MEKLIIELEDEINIRVKELSLILINVSRINENKMNKYFLPAIYANWEAFIKNSFKLYFEFLDYNGKLNNEHFISLIIRNEEIFEGNLKELDRIKKVLNELNQIYSDPVFDLEKFKFKILTFDNTNKLFDQFHIPQLNKIHRVELNTFVNHRNWVAHGIQEVFLNDISLEDIRNYITLIEDLMYEFFYNIQTMEK